MLHAVIRVVVFAQIVLVRPQWLCAVGAEAPKQCEPYVKTLFKWNLETKKEDQSIEIEVDDVSIKHIRTVSHIANRWFCPDDLVLCAL